MENMRTLAILFLVGLGLASATNPGVKLRVTKNGINYANSVAQAALAKELNTMKIPDQSGDDHGLSWKLKNIQNQGVTPPGSAIVLDPSHNGLSWTLSNFGLNLKADWRVQYKKGWFKISDSGSVTVSLGGISVSVTISLGVDKTHRPSISMATCDANIGSVHVKFHGGTAFIWNLFSGILEDKIKHILRDKICDVVAKEINEDGEAKLAKLKVMIEMDHRFLLDYSLTAAPAITAEYLEVQDKGEVYWKDAIVEAPFSPGAIPPLSDVSRMLYLWVTDYLFNTYLYVAQTHDYLKLNVTSQDLPAGNRSYLNTTCTSLCVGKLIPQIGKMYPNSVVEIRLASKSVPYMNISQQGIEIGLKADIAMYAHLPTNKTVYLLTLNMTLYLAATPKIQNERLVGNISSKSFKIGVVKSAVGPLNAHILDLIIGGAFDLVVIPELNKFAKAGFDLPITGEIKLQKTNLSLLPGALLLSTDLLYEASDTNLIFRSEIEHNQ